MTTEAAPPGPLITVYLVNHNYGRYLAQSIESVLTQTCRDFELLIIDDGSTDDSSDVIKHYADRDGLYTIFQKNRGLNATNNIALRAARGRYIMRLDADDYLDQHALEILSGVLTRAGDIDMAFPDYYHVDETGNVIELVRRHDFTQVTLMDQPAHGACTMIRREVLEKLGGYDESFRCQDGYDLWIRFIQHHKVKNVNLPLFYYRQHGRSLTSNERRILGTRAEILRKHVEGNGAPLSTLAVIPVRDARTDPRSIALRPLGSKRAIDWTLEAALAAHKVGDVLLTTPDEDLLSYVRGRYGEKVVCLPRDRALAQMNTFTWDTLRDAVTRYSALRKRPDAILELFVESPFRSQEVLDTAVDVLGAFEADRVIGVRPEIWDFYQHDGGGLRPLRQNRRLRLESDELLRSAGGLSVIRTDFLERGEIDGDGRVSHVIVDERSAFSIMSEWQWSIAEFEASRIESEHRAAQAIPAQTP